MTGRYTVQAVDNAMRLLMLVADAPDLGLSELSRRAASAKARTYRQLCTLEELGLLACDPAARTYRLGPAALHLGQQAVRQVDIVILARPLLAELGQRFDETIQLRQREGDETVCVAIWEGERPLRNHGEVGLRRPLHAGSSKVVLAHLPVHEQERILQGTLRRFTARTNSSQMRLRKELPDIRRAGYCVTRGEINEGLVSVAVPIILPGNVAWGLINLASGSGRVGTEQITGIVSALKEAAATIMATMSGAASPGLHTPLMTGSQDGPLRRA